MFDSQSNSMICLNGLVLRREALHSASNARFLLDSMFDFAERLNSLRLTDHEVGLFCAVVVIAAGKLKTIQFLIFSFFQEQISILSIYKLQTSNYDFLSPCHHFLEINITRICSLIIHLIAMKFGMV